MDLLDFSSQIAGYIKNIEADWFATNIWQANIWQNQKLPTFGKTKSCQHLATFCEIDNENWQATNL